MAMTSCPQHTQQHTGDAPTHRPRDSQVAESQLALTCRTRSVFVLDRNSVLRVAEHQFLWQVIAFVAMAAFES